NSLKEGFDSDVIKAFSNYFERLKSEQPPVKRPAGLGIKEPSDNFVDMDEKEIAQYLEDCGFHKI
ncbi:MAG: hypothetical protein KAT83_02210, partial [Candidatus Aenigmarchaeota archaeon]|nr:hypothetical protein [Candidatus Aenigmarchaeota archaeon]